METEHSSWISAYLEKKTKAAPLAVFRILFGLIMAVSIIRFWYNGWIEKLYLLPKLQFHYTGFDLIEVPGNYIYLLFLVCLISALFISIGFQYKISILVFFLSFTYIELLDKSTYLNHYYFVSVISFILIWLPANCAYSYDAYVRPSLRSEYLPSWTIDIIKLMLAIVYIYAGLAKLNTDWMLEAMPLSIWLPTKFEVPFIGGLMHESWVHYLFSWGGALYDITIVFFLLWKRTRVFAFIIVVLFHLMTRILFPIGMFPYIMIISTFIFFSADFHEKCLNRIASLLKIRMQAFSQNDLAFTSKKLRLNLYVLTLFMLFQIIFPLRSLAYTDNVYWTEQGYRFSWRVMLMEKTGYANFKIVDSKTKKRFYVQNDDFLTPFQQKQMSTQPDFILEYGQYLGNHFKSQGHQNVQVFVESYAALNGRKSQQFIAANVDLTKTTYSDLCKNHIIPLHE